ncbi:SRPBCC family protein [Sediminimonas sp.]|uniref:SRPBCC family protein n=1 Tax=Sediminimonas sp. TaxID=2823379 RepID=UPI0025CEC4F9|nr:SRPBCC family protein [Sediminimonas sp.]
MKFSGKADVDAPIDKVFAVLTDFELIERAAMRRGVEVQRTDTLRAPGAGVGWHVKFTMRGKPRETDIAITGFDAPNEIVLSAELQGMEAVTRVELVALSRSQTRLGVVTDLTPTTLAARLMVQSLRMARGKLDKRFKARVADYARDLGERAQRA